MVESLRCPKCSLVVQPDQAYCGKCGTLLPSAAQQAAASGEIAPAEVGAESPAAGGGPQPARTRGKGSRTSAANAAATGATPAPEAPRAAPGAAPVSAVDPRIAALGLSPAPPDAATQARAVWPPPPPSSFAAPAPPTPPAPLASSPLTGPVRNPFAPPAAAQFAPPAPEPLQIEVVAGAAPEVTPQHIEEVAGAAPEVTPEHVPGGYVPPFGGPEAPVWALRPSSASSDARPAGSSMSVSVGAIPVSSVTPRPRDPEAAPAPRPNLPAVWPPASAPLPPAPLAPLPPLASAPGPQLHRSPFAAPPALPVAPAAPAPPGTVASPRVGPAGKETTQELVAFGLVAAGAAIGIASLFLPWAASNGSGVGTTGASPTANDVGLRMPAAIPLLILSAIVLGAASGSDRARERLPNLASVIARVTDSIMPMILGGLYFGVVLLYVTLPWGFGMGVFALFVGAVLLIAGAVVPMFLPQKRPHRPD